MQEFWYTRNEWLSLLTDDLGCILFALIQNDTSGYAHEECSREQHLLVDGLLALLHFTLHFEQVVHSEHMQLDELTLS